MPSRTATLSIGAPTRTTFHTPSHRPGHLGLLLAGATGGCSSLPCWEQLPSSSYGAAVRAAERIPGARLVSVESGGHLLLGQAETVRHEAGGFLAGGGTD